MEKILIFIPIENIGLEKYVQNLSLFTILSLIFSLYYLISLKRIKKSPILNKLFLLILWLIIVTVVRFFLTQYVGEDFERVFAGLSIGILEFLTLRYIFYKANNKKIWIWLNIGYILLLIFSLYDLIHKFPHRLRLYASYTEPSHLGNDLVLIYLPFFMLYKPYYSKIKFFLIITSFFIVLLLTFSSTAFVKFIFYAFLLLLITMSFGTLILIISIILVLIVVLIYLFPDNYAVIMIQAVINNINLKNLNFDYKYLPVSFTDRGSFLIFLLNISNLKFFTTDRFVELFFGNGLGADRKFLDYLPPVVAKQILSVKFFGSYITSFLGRIIAYGGVIGIVLYLIFFFSAVKTIEKLNLDKNSKVILYSSLFTLLFSCSFDLAPFQEISLWFWLAYIDGLLLRFL